mgnify:CR=1 FL=1
MHRPTEEERRRNAELPIDSLIALAALRELKRLRPCSKSFEH